MIAGKERVQQPPGLAVTMNVDGFGDRPNKVSKYHQFTHDGTRFHRGYKLFYEEDTNLMTPGSVLSRCSRARTSSSTSDAGWPAPPFTGVSRRRPPTIAFAVAMPGPPRAMMSPLGSIDRRVLCAAALRARRRALRPSPAGRPRLARSP